MSMQYYCGKELRLREFYWFKCPGRLGVQRFFIFRPYFFDGTISADAIWVEFVGDKSIVTDQSRYYEIKAWEWIDSESITSFPRQDALREFLKSFPKKTTPFVPEYEG